MKRKNEAGSALLLVTLGLGVLIGIMGLAVDVDEVGLEPPDDLA